MRSIILVAVAAGLVVVGAADVGFAADKKPRAQQPRPQHWAIGCTNDACVIVRDDGEVRFADLNNLDGQTGIGRLPERPVPPVSIGCDHDVVKVTESCLIVDGLGRTWVGAPRPPANFHRAPFETLK